MSNPWKLAFQYVFSRGNNSFEFFWPITALISNIGPGGHNNDVDALFRFTQAQQGLPSKAYLTLSR